MIVLITPSNRTMKHTLFLLAFCAGVAVFNAATLMAQSLEIRQYTGGFIHVKAQAGLDLMIRPNDSAEIPGNLNAKPEFVLGQKLNPMVLQANGQQAFASPQPGNGPPGDGFLIQSVMIGRQRAAIELKASDFNVLFVSVDIMSDQGFIARGKDRKVNLIVLTFSDAKKLHNARTNLWLSTMETQQIALNPISEFPAASVDKFYESLKRNRILPTAVLPMIDVPNRLLKFGDRQVVLLKQLR